MLAEPLKSLGKKGTNAQNRKEFLEKLYREQKRHIKLLHIKFFPVAPVTGPPSRESGQKDLCSSGSEDST